MNNKSEVGSTEGSAPLLVLVSKSKTVYDGLNSYNDTGFEIQQCSGIKQFTRLAKSRSAVVILDLKVVDNDVHAARRRIIRIKRHNPASIIIIVGSKEVLVELLKTDVQAVVFRTFSEPMSYRQMALSLTPAIKAGQGLQELLGTGGSLLYEFHEEPVKPNEAPQVTSSKKTVYIALLSLLAAAGILVLVAFLRVPERFESFKQTTVEANIEVDEDEQSQHIAELFELAKAAQIDGRIIEPEGNNMFVYYEQILAIDPYDVTAYKAKQKIVKWLKKTIPTYIKKQQFSRAQTGMGIFRQLDPLNDLNKEYEGQLNQAVKFEISQAEEHSDISQTRRLKRVLQSLGQNFVDAQEKVALLEQEHEQVFAIDQALDAGNISPGAINSAFNLIMEARRNQSVTVKNLNSRAFVLSDIFLMQAEQAIDDKEISRAKRLLGAARALEVKRQAVIKIEEQLKSS